MTSFTIDVLESVCREERLAVSPSGPQGDDGLVTYELTGGWTVGVWEGDGWDHIEWVREPSGLLMSPTPDNALYNWEPTCATHDPTRGGCVHWGYY